MSGLDKELNPNARLDTKSIDEPKITSKITLLWNNTKIIMRRNNHSKHKMPLRRKILIKSYGHKITPKRQQYKKARSIKQNSRQQTIDKNTRPSD